jgi:hypothetical protein
MKKFNKKHERIAKKIKFDRIFFYSFLETNTRYLFSCFLVPVLKANSPAKNAVSIHRGLVPGPPQVTKSSL